jgi:hypothetical protein
MGVVIENHEDMPEEECTKKKCMKKRKKQRNRCNSNSHLRYLKAVHFERLFLCPIVPPLQS